MVWVVCILAASDIHVLVGVYPCYSKGDCVSPTCVSGGLHAAGLIEIEHLVR
jgi:hypothetical protein